MIKYRRLRWAGRVARMEEGRNAFKILIGKSKGKRPLGMPGHRWEDNKIKEDMENLVDTLTLTEVLVNQKRMNICKHTVKMMPHDCFE